MRRLFHKVAVPMIFYLWKWIVARVDVDSQAVDCRVAMLLAMKKSTMNVIARFLRNRGDPFLIFTIAGGPGLLPQCGACSQ